jgi:hypothetical protein
MKFIHLLVGHGAWEPDDGRIAVPLGSEITFLCGPGGLLSGGVSKSVVDCVQSKQDLAGVLALVKTVGVIPDMETFTAEYDINKKVPEKAAKYPRRVTAQKGNQARTVPNYTLGADEVPAYVQTFENGASKGTHQFGDAVLLSEIVEHCRSRNMLPAHFVWVACRDHTYEFNPKYAEVSWVTADELAALTST